MGGGAYNTLVGMGIMSERTKDLHYEPRQFPQGFLWGTGTSSYQVEGGNQRADWWKWEQEGGHIADGTTSGRAVDYWNRYREDFALASEHLHNNAYRMSVEWSRLEPSEGEWDEEAFTHYREMLTEAKRCGLQIMLTVHHFTNPQWLMDKGGWETRKVIHFYTRFVQKLCDELGEFVDLWCTINEPMVYVLQGYIFLEWPPQRRSYYKAAKVVWHQTRCHRAAYKLIHAWAHERNRVTHVGIANNVSSMTIYRKHSFLDHLAAALIDRGMNHVFYYLSGMRTHDYLGLNYYFHFRIKSVWDFLKRKGPVETSQSAQFESSDIGWELFPHGIFDVCMDMAGYKKPIYITENGLATTNDDKRIRVIVGFLMQLHYAVQEGADVRGYFHWSLLDNFEWAKGYAPTFGLVEVDRASMRRTPRTSAMVYGMIAEKNAIEHDFLRFLGHGTTDILNEWKKSHTQT